MFSEVRNIYSSKTKQKTIETMLVFENMTVDEQVRDMRRSDIVIAAHGAGQTNVAFMRPCSILIEITPYGYKSTFGPLMVETGIAFHY